MHLNCCRAWCLLLCTFRTPPPTDDHSYVLLFQRCGGQTGLSVGPTLSHLSQQLLTRRRRQLCSVQPERSGTSRQRQRRLHDQDLAIQAPDADGRQCRRPDLDIILRRHRSTLRLVAHPHARSIEFWRDLLGHEPMLGVLWPGLWPIGSVSWVSQSSRWS